MKKIISLFVFSFILYQSAFAQSLCWQIRGKGIKSPSYIYGTMHLADQRVIDKANNATKLLAKSKVYAMELDPDNVDMSKVFKLLTASTGHSIKAQLTDQEWQLLDAIFKAKTNTSVSSFDSVQPFIIATLISTTINTNNDEKATILDLHFYNLAQIKKIPTIGIETVDEQLDVFAKLSYAEQITMLRKAILEENTNQNEFDYIMKYYLAGDIDSLLDLSNDPSIPKEFADALLKSRNEKMAMRIASFIKSKSHFIGIGALHLPGEQGVLNLLRKKGFKITAVK